MILPTEARPLLAALACGLTRPTFGRFAVLLAAAILTQGRHTVANLLRTLGSLATGHWTDYQRVLSLEATVPCRRETTRRPAGGGHGPAGALFRGMTPGGRLAPPRSSPDRPGR